MPTQNALIDQNQTPTLLGVQGTAGTADTTGTSLLVRLSVDPATGALYTESLAGTTRKDPRPTVNILTYGTTFGSSGSGYGTLIGSQGVGTAIWVNDLSIINSKGGTVTGLLGFGTSLNGTSVLVKGDFASQDGIQKSYPLAVNCGITNADLVCYLGGAGTMDFIVSYFIL